MESSSLPVPLAKAILRLMPALVLENALEIVLKRMRGRHPKLFKNLAALPAAVIYLEPTDLPHSFVLEVGTDPATFTVLQDQDKEPQARVSGRLEMLVDMLEGRADGDMLFFARDIQITGDTSVIVGLRNTLDREEIDLFTEILSLCGPFAGSARVALTLADKVARRIRASMECPHDTLRDMKKAPQA